MAKIKHSNELAGGCASLFGLPFLCAGLFMTWLYFNGYARWWNARDWEEVPCWVETAELKSSRDGKSTSYRASATYRYEYQGREYHGDRVTFKDGSDNVGGFQKEAYSELSRHVVKNPATAERGSQQVSAATFRCFVNPAKPSEAVLYRALRWEMQAFYSVFALTFPAVGAGLVFGGLLGARSLRREAALRESHPAEPWRWKSAWVGNSIPENDGPRKSALYLYTLWSGCIVVPLIAATAMSDSFQQSPTSWLVLIFAVLWAFPAWFSSKRLRHRHAVGVVKLELMDAPASPGGPLNGDIMFEKPLPLRGTPEISLYCEKCVTRGTGKQRSTTTERIWSHQEIVPQELIARDSSGFRLPVSFAVPADAPASDSGNDSDTKYTWKLEFKVPDTPIHSVFEVPVFRTEKSSLPQVPYSGAVAR